MIYNFTLSLNALTLYRSIKSNNDTQVRGEQINKDIMVGVYGRSDGKGNVSWILVKVLITFKLCIVNNEILCGEMQHVS